MQKVKNFVILGMCALSLLSFAPALAQPDDPLGLGYAAETGLAKTDVRIATARIIRTVLGLLGIIAVAIVVFAGFRWMTSGGNEERIKSAQKTLTAAIIGLVIILSAYMITNFVISELYQATQGEAYGTN